MGRKSRGRSLWLLSIQKKRVEEEGSGDEYEYGGDDGYGIYGLDDYEEEHSESPPKSFAWINGLGIVVGVVGAVFGLPLFF